MPKFLRPIRMIIRKSINVLGYDYHRIEKKEIFDDNVFRRICQNNCAALKEKNIRKIHYGCGHTFFEEEWLNVDLVPDINYKDKPNVHNYMFVDLAKYHPFIDDYFMFGFAEDFLEHLDQAESITFLTEAYRTIEPGGVLRLSFPGLESVLEKHFTSSHYIDVSTGQNEAYYMWGHKHFYSRDSLNLVAKHIGYKKVDFMDFGNSSYSELCGLDSREDQKDLNIIVELTK